MKNKILTWAFFFADPTLPPENSARSRIWIYWNPQQQSSLPWLAYYTEPDTIESDAEPDTFEPDAEPDAEPDTFESDADSDSEPGAIEPRPHVLITQFPEWCHMVSFLLFFR
jgi:hypothetical protein